MFSVSLCQYLRHLEDLHIESCGLEEIVAKENGSEEHRFDFPQLTKIRLWNLPSLKSFYPGRHSLECHSLKELSVYHCEALQIFSFDHSDFLHPPNKYIQQSLFTFENVCPNLELLTLNEKDAMMLFSAEGISQHSIGAPSQFRELLLTDLDQLEYIWNEDFQSDALIQNLDRLQIIGCPSLVILLPSISFQSLTTLYVDGCKRLTYLIRSLTAKSLVRLKELAIKNCKMIEQVVIDEEEAKEEFIFESLEYLELISLSSFKSFCSGKHTFIFPSLVGLTITGCPKMQTFSPGVIIAPFLTAVVVENQKKRWKDDLNTTIKQLFIDKEVQQEVKGIVQTLSLSGSDDRRTWKASFSGEAKEGKESNESCETAQNSVPTPSIPFPWQALCEMKIPQRLISFIWTLHNSALPMADKCHLCGQQSETLDHLFLHCTFAKAIWFGSDLCLRTDQLQPDSIHGWLNIWFSQLLNHGHEMHDMTVLILLILDNIWQARNQRCMDGCLPNAQACLMKVKAQWKEYRNALMVEECVLQ
ncbi:putative Rpp4C4 [Senna tora]|uniref:Putative Rpp4C4 n=1 Tax=Senna tora TaxID=362788 RepID=A0A834WNE8_9FABA|nr:putative Rpp4C4 [Senna tora]